MQKALHLRPPKTVMQMYEILPDGTRSEVIDNTIYMPPSPSEIHQDIVIGLNARIKIFVDDTLAGKFYVAPLSVYFDEQNVYEPDMLFISAENKKIIKGGIIKGVPDLIIEILSRGNQNYDLKTKYAKYEYFGVKEYFVIDPITKEVLHFILKKVSTRNRKQQRRKLNRKSLMLHSHSKTHPSR